MATINSKHAIDNRTTATNQQFVALLGMIAIFSGVSTISSHVTTKLLTRLFLHSHYFKFLAISQSLSRSKALDIGF